MPNRKGSQEPQNPVQDMWFSYKFGIHDFALYKWKGKDYNIDTKICKTENRYDTEVEIKRRAAQPGSDIVFVHSDSQYIYYQDLRGDLTNYIIKKGSRKRKNPEIVDSAPTSPMSAHAPYIHHSPEAVVHLEKKHLPQPIPVLEVNPSIQTQAIISPTTVVRPRPLLEPLETEKNRGEPNVAKEFSSNIFQGISSMPSSEFSAVNASRIIHDEFHFDHGEGLELEPPSFLSRTLRSNTTNRDDLGGVRSIEGIKSVNNYLESKFFRRGSNEHNVLDTHLSTFYMNKFCGPWEFFSIFNDYRNRDFAMYRFSGPACTPLMLELQKDKGITICAIWHIKYWKQISQARKNSKRDGEKAIDLFVDANNTRIVDGDILICKVAHPYHGKFADLIVLEGKGGIPRRLSVIKRAEAQTEMFQILRHLVLRLLACLSVVQIPKVYDGKTLKELGLQNNGLTIWSTIKKIGGNSVESYVDAKTKLERGVYVVVKKSHASANLEEKCNMFSRGELGWLDTSDSMPGSAHVGSTDFGSFEVLAL
ncbi:hypothetical protein AAMO2058_001431500 [Amorphochlora amoebiformis]